MSTLDFMLDRLRDSKSILESKYHVKSIGIFGSFVRNAQKPGSDVDGPIQKLLESLKGLF
jgi:uncharacterized protein